MSGKPDPKPTRRVVDPAAVRRAGLREDECGSCRRPGSNSHHVIPKGSPHHGDDIEENAIVVCGTGSQGCHGALHGSAYVDRAGKRWAESDVRYALGRTILSRRRDIIGYVLTKLGPSAGAAWLERRYQILSSEIRCELEAAEKEGSE